MGTGEAVSRGRRISLVVVGHPSSKGSLGEPLCGRVLVEKDRGSTV